MRAVQTAIEIGVPGVLGIHIEGPFLNEERKGVHDATKLRWLDEDALGLLTSLNGGRTLVTLAPERTTPADHPQARRRRRDRLRRPHQRHLRRDQGRARRRASRGFTHLFNAMSQLTGREPGAVGAALDDAGQLVRHHRRRPSRRSGRAAHRVALQAAGPLHAGDRRDAERRRAEQGFKLQGRPISVADNMCVDEHGRLAGSDIDMASAVRNAVSMLGVDLERSLRMASRYPAAFLRLGHELGRIAPGYARQPRAARRAARRRRNLDRRRAADQDLAG